MEMVQPKSINELTSSLGDRGIRKIIRIESSEENRSNPVNLSCDESDQT